MKRIKKNLKLVEKTNGDVFSKSVPIKPLGGKRFSILDRDYDITPAIQNYFTKTYLTTQPMKMKINQ